MALADDWDPVALEAAARAQSAASRVLGVPSPLEMAQEHLRRTGHSSALRGRDLKVLPGGVVIASPRQRPPRTPSPSRSAPVGQPRPAPSGRSAGDVLRIVASGPAALGNGIANASTGGSGDTALGRLLGAVIAGVLVLELGSLAAKKFFAVSLGGGSVAVSPAPTTAQNPVVTPSGQSLGGILGYIPSVGAGNAAAAQAGGTAGDPSQAAAQSAAAQAAGSGGLTPASVVQILGYNP